MAKRVPSRWTVLSLGIAAQASASAFLYGLPFLVPYLRRAGQLSLVQAAALVAAPSLGLVLTLVAWGALADRFGERAVMASGLGLAGALLLASLGLESYVGRWTAWALVGAAGASVNAASGRAVMGWFGVHERGLAMGARQMSQPLGVALAGLTLPALATAHGLRAALAAPALACLVVAALVAAFVVDPPRTPAERTPTTLRESPYAAPTLWRVHGASALLVVPQFAVAGFGAEFLVRTRGWDAAHAGRVLAAVSLAGALGRLAAGRWSDIVGSRLRPMRQIAVVCAAVMVSLGVGAASGSALVLVPLALAAIVSVTDNGLGYTATAEIAGRAWSGRALGMQNTAQNLVAFATPPVFAGLVGLGGYPWAFGLCALTPALAAVATPVQRAHRQRPCSPAAPPFGPGAPFDGAAHEQRRRS